MARSHAAELAALVAQATAELGMEAATEREGMAYAVGKMVVVRVAGETAEFRLRTDVAAAAARTPEAGPSPRGPEWVSFSPTTFDRFTTDRVTAWCEFAAKEAKGSTKAP